MRCVLRPFRLAWGLGVQMLKVDHEIRIRHLKCDESKPNCTRCLKSGYKCDGYDAPPISPPRNTRSRKTPPPKVHNTLPTLPRFDDPRQRDIFAFFVSCSSDSSSLYFGADFWARRVLQLSLSEDSIRYALCSLSALQRITTESSFNLKELRSYALQ
jgi:hypothetical protein